MSIYKCWGCGAEGEFKREPQTRLYCDECFEAHRKQYKEIVSEYARLKIIVMHETALRTMEKAEVYMHEYMDAAQIVLEKAMSNSESFYSSDEMVVGIILDEYGYEYYPNYSIGKYRVDFYIPELKVCVEVDGHLHKGKEVFDSNRDIELRKTLGSEWEIIRIPTKYIEKNPPVIPEAIEVLAKNKRELRSKNNGIMPDWYSMREKKHYESILGYKTKKVRNI